MAATIGELVIELKASTAQFSSDLQAARTQTVAAVGGIQESVNGLSDTFARLGAFIGVASIAEWVKGSVEYAHQIGNLSKVIGDSVEQTSRLAYAAKMADIDVETLSKTMGALSRTLLQAQTGVKKPEALFGFLGVDPKSVSSTTDLLLQMVDAFSKLPPSIDRTAIATALFQRTGVNLVPFLSMTREELQKLMDQSDATGATVTKSQADMSEKLQNAYNQIILSAKAFTVELVTHLSPGLLDSADKFKTWEERIGGAKDVADKVVDAIHKIIGALNELSGSGAPSGIKWLDDLATKYPKIFGNQPIANLGPSRFQIGDTLPGGSPGTASLSQLSQLDLPKFAPPAPLPPAAPALISGGSNPLSPGASGDLFSTAYAAGTDAAGRYKAMLESLDPAHQKLIDDLAKVKTGLESEIGALLVGASGAQSAKNATELLRLSKEGATTAELASVNAEQREVSFLTGLSAMTKNTAQDFQKLNEAFRTTDAKTLQGQMLELGKSFSALGAQQYGANPLAGLGIDTVAQADANAMTEKINGMVEALQLQNAELKVTPQEWARIQLSIEGANTAQIAAVKTAQDHLQRTKDLTKAYDEFGRASYQSLDDLIFKGKSLGDVFSELATKIGEMALQWSLFGSGGKGGLFGSLGTLLGISGGGSSGGLSGFFGSLFRAEGGPVSAGRPYIVGEQWIPELLVPESGTPRVVGLHGPELLIPETSGMIITAKEAGDKISSFASVTKQAVILPSNINLKNVFPAEMFRALGGAAYANMPLVVGEQGPELFVPGANGAILPNGMSMPTNAGVGQGGDTYIYNVDARGAQVGFVPTIMAAIQASEDRAVARSVRTVKDLSLRTA